MNPVPTFTDTAANVLLAAMPPEDLARWLPHLEPVSVRAGEVLYELDVPPVFAYFPTTAVLSLQVPTQDGYSDEVGVVGREGMLGAALVTGVAASTMRVVVQSAGLVFRVPRTWIIEEFRNSPNVMHMLLRYAMARSAELAHGIVCGRHHTVTQRLCLRLLQAMDRQEGVNLRTTQEQLAGLLGVRRQTISQEARKLRQAGVIGTSRGCICVLNRAWLEDHSCECYSLVTKVYERLALDLRAPPANAQFVRDDLATYLQKVREEERGALARELHDELGSLLTCAKLDLAGLKMRVAGESGEIDQRLKHLEEMINLGIAFSRRVVEGLHPSSLTNLGLAASLMNLSRDFEKGTGIATRITADEVQVDEEIQLTIYRVVQESLNNISKYAHAHEVGISMLNGASDVIIAVRDDGQGFDTAAGGTASHGLASMRHRVQACSGELTISSTPGAGTMVVAVLPARSPLAKSGIPVQ